MYSLIESYLNNRKQQVKIDEVLSDPEYISYGVPQGTVLGPLLFTIYINDLLTLKTKGDVLSFADDTAVWYESGTWELLRTKTEKDFVTIKNWFQQNELTLNVAKTKYMPFTSYSVNLPHLGPLNVGDVQIPETESIKYLGIILDRHLRWNLHMDSTVRKIRSLLPRLKCLREYLDDESLKKIYYALVQSQLTYGIIGWGGVLDSHLKNLNVIQKWAIKLIFRKSPIYPTDTLFKDGGLLDIRQLFCQRILTFIFKGKISLHSVCHSYSTRNQDSCFLPRSDKTIGQRHVDYLAPRLYNIVPDSVKIVRTHQQFKYKTKRWFLETGKKIFHDVVDQNVLL